MAGPKKEKTVQGWKMFPKDPLGEARIWVPHYHGQNLSRCSTAATITVTHGCPTPCQGPPPAGAAPAEQEAGQPLIPGLSLHHELYLGLGPWGRLAKGICVWALSLRD